jgi:hypothetical protein
MILGEGQPAPPGDPESWVLLVGRTKISPVKRAFALPHFSAPGGGTKRRCVGPEEEVSSWSIF